MDIFRRENQKQRIKLESNNNKENVFEKNENIKRQKKFLVINTVFIFMIQLKNKF